MGGFLISGRLGLVPQYWHVGLPPRRLAGTGRFTHEGSIRLGGVASITHGGSDLFDVLMIRRVRARLVRPFGARGCEGWPEADPRRTAARFRRWSQKPPGPAARLTRLHLTRRRDGGGRLEAGTKSIGHENCV